MYEYGNREQGRASQIDFWEYIIRIFLAVRTYIVYVFYTVYVHLNNIVYFHSNAE
jgi:hypothetical protein